MTPQRRMSDELLERAFGLLVPWVLSQVLIQKQQNCLGVVARDILESSLCVVEVFVAYEGLHFVERVISTYQQRPRPE